MQDKHYLDDWIHVPICQKGDKLYHYTTAEGIRGIVENREFVATKSDFLNDKMEFQYCEYGFAHAVFRKAEGGN